MLPLDELTREDLAVLKRVVPATDHELWAWIKVVCGLQVPRVAVCPHHCAPFDWIADAYFDRVQKQVVLASRGGGKTWGAAALAYAELLHRPGIEIGSVGAILKQAKKMYRYFRAFSRHDVELGFCRPPTMEATEFDGGGRIEIITGKTKEAVNSPHPHRVTIDEYELMDLEVLEEALLMPIEAGGHRHSIRLLSTRKFATGNVQKMIDEAPERGYRVYQFCALECAEQCTEQVRPSCEPCKSIVRYDQNNQPVTWYDICQERLRHARGFLSINKLIDDFRGISVEIFKTQVAPCDRPSRGDACFSEYSDSIHLIDYDYDPGLPIGTGWDFGLDDPNVCIFFQWTPEGDVVAFDEICSGEIATASEHAKMMVDQIGRVALARPGYGERLREDEAEHWADPAGKARRVYTRVDTDSAFSLLRGMGIEVRGKKNPSMPRRIRALKMKLRLHELTRRPSFYVARRCKRLAAAFAFAQWRKTEATGETKNEYEHNEHSHPLDACGYFIDALWPPAGDDDDDSEVTADY